MSVPEPNSTIVLPESFLRLCDPTGELSGWLAPSIALALTALTIGLVVVRWRARRIAVRPSRGFWALSAVPVVLGLTLSLALAVNSWVGYFPSFTALGQWMSGVPQNRDNGGDYGVGSREPTTEQTSAAFQVTIPGSRSGVPAGQAWVYLPAGYDQHPEREYRLIIGLHGDPGKGADWFSGGNAQSTLDDLIAGDALPEVLFLSPDLSSGLGAKYQEPVNIPNGPAIADFVAQDVVGWADAQLRTTGRAQDRVIAGFSSGGFGSIVIGLRNPDVFGGIVSIAPYTKPFTKAVADTPELRRDWSPLDLVARAVHLPPLFLGVAGGEPVANANAIASELTARSAIFTKRVLSNGPHTWQTARTLFPFGLVWMAEQLHWKHPLDGDMTAFPASCQPTPN